MRQPVHVACSGVDQPDPDHVIGSDRRPHDVATNCEEGLVLTVHHVHGFHVARGNAGVSNGTYALSSVKTKTPRDSIATGGSSCSRLRRVARVPLVALRWRSGGAVTASRKAQWARRRRTSVRSDLVSHASAGQCTLARELRRQGAGFMRLTPADSSIHHGGLAAGSLLESLPRSHSPPPATVVELRPDGRLRRSPGRHRRWSGSAR